MSSKGAAAAAGAKKLPSRTAATLRKENSTNVKVPPLLRLTEALEKSA